VEEKISLSTLRAVVSFYPFDQDEFLAIMAHWLRELGCRESEIPKARQEALQWGAAARLGSAASPGSSRATTPGATPPTASPGAEPAAMSAPVDVPPWRC